MRLEIVTSLLFIGLAAFSTVMTPAVALPFDSPNYGYCPAGTCNPYEGRSAPNPKRFCKAQYCHRSN